MVYLKKNQFISASCRKWFVAKCIIKLFLLFLPILNFIIYGSICRNMVCSIAFFQYFLCFTLANVFLSSFCPIWYAIEIDNCRAARPPTLIRHPRPFYHSVHSPHSLPTALHDSRLCITITVIWYESSTSLASPLPGCHSYAMCAATKSWQGEIPQGATNLNTPFRGREKRQLSGKGFHLRNNKIKGI